MTNNDEQIPEFNEEEFYEGISKRLAFTGSTGVNTLQDGSIRTAAVGIPAGILWFLQVEWNILSTEGYAALATIMIPASILAWTIFDKLIKPRLITP